ncbi:MAG TPA: enoyl-CoA hydratase/isomerase family protein [Streptosporangiales bacterium]
MQTSGVAVEIEGPVAEVVVGTGRRRNAMTGAGWDRLAVVLRNVAASSAVRAVVVRGAGETFCAGSDMTEWQDADLAQVERSFARMEAAFRAIEECPVPVVAEIRGAAAGAGCELALACDLRVMARSARIGMPIARLGILPSPAFASRLAAVAGPAVARELLYTGRLLDAPAAVSAGLANHAVPDAELTVYVAGLVAEITDQPPAAVRAAKAAVTAGTWRPSRVPTGPAVSPADFYAGISAFLSHRDKAAS